jgi:Response regulator of the LytR/AlgR family
MNCLILDDEPLALKILEDYIKHIPFLELQGKCYGASEAYEILRNKKIDLLFLDIQMPNISGIDFINSLGTKPLFIITTAFMEYAIEGFNLNAVDYLLKPIPFDRFLKAVNKAYDLHLLIQHSLQHAAQPNLSTPIQTPALETSASQFLLVKADYQTLRIHFDTILYIEGLKDYVKIFTTKDIKPIITHLNIKSINEKLPPNGFTRVHKSYIVSMSKINSITKNRIVMGEKWIPIGDNYKELFFQKFNSGS